MSDGDKRIKTALQIFIAGAVILALLGAGTKIMNFYTEFGTSILISIILTIIAELIVIRFGGEFLKQHHITIWGFRVSVFFILVILVKYLVLS
ncbi:hypothetical protein HYT53_04510 [Candidatus Woesearchaeota archaeon]|nr:hypothetical protein [Candidatus Woesearchaeota archaeon]